MILSVDIRRKAFGDASAGAGRERHVLARIAFDLGAREIVALVGPSGCGKTTLLKIIGGLDRDFDGQLRWGAAAPRIGTVFQEPRLLAWRTVWQNLALVLPPDADPAAADALLEALGLAAFRDAWASELSLGMARRLAIARAFVIDPELVLLDEPFVSLDEAMAARGRAVLLEAWRRRPTAILLVTHDLNEAASLADRILLLSPSPSQIVAELSVPAARRRSGAPAVDVVAELRRLSSAEITGHSAPRSGLPLS